MQLTYIVSFLSSRHSRFGVFFDWLVLIAVLYVLIDYVDKEHDGSNQN